jgi:hypothetical protein
MVGAPFDRRHRTAVSAVLRWALDGIERAMLSRSISRSISREEVRSVRGCVRKDERLSTAFARILKEETGIVSTIDQATFVGNFEQFYPANRFGEAGFGTHYVSLAYRLSFEDRSTALVDRQDAEFNRCLASQKWLIHIPKYTLTF